MTDQSAKPVTWGQEIRKEKHDVLQVMIHKIIDQPFKGTFHVSEEMPVWIAGMDYDKTGEHFGECIAAAIRAWGAEPAIAHVLPHGYAPYDTVCVGGTMPLVPTSAEQGHHMIEAGAEVIRLILSAAIISAKADCAPDEKVIVLCQRPPEFIAAKDMKVVTMLCGFFGTVIRSRAPEKSYLLGSSSGQKSHKLLWDLPMADFYYGPRRIRWLDNRSVGHIEQEQIMKAPVSAGRLN